MREILFRGKRTDNSEWIEGFLLKECNHSTCSWNLGIEYKTERSGVFAYGVAEIISETVGQYTGLTDKNETKIYEGDIVNIELMHPKGFANYEIGCIKYNDAKARFVFCTNEGNYNYDDTDRFEIIGNIHDNPELLGGNYCG